MVSCQGQWILFIKYVASETWMAYLIENDLYERPVEIYTQMLKISPSPRKFKDVVAVPSLKFLN